MNKKTAHIFGEIKHILGCFECPHCKIGGNKYLCSKLDKEIPDDNIGQKVLPDNCPLEDQPFKERKKELLETLERAKRTVDRWPEWKKGYVASSDKTCNDKPRKPLKIKHNL